MSVWVRKRFWVSAVFLILVVWFCRANAEVPVLMYHRIDDFSEPISTTVGPRVFENQMEFLKVHHYRVIALAELVESLKSGLPIPPKTVVITFDDGTLDNIQNAFPVLKKMGFPATVFMITDNIGREGWLSEEDLRVLDDAGISIGSHTVHHAFLPKLERPEAEKELKDSKKRLEEILGHPVTLFSYPAGGFTPGIRSLVEEAGYEGAVTTNHGRQRQDPFALHRVKITDGAGGLFNFWWKTSGLYQVGRKRAQATAAWE